MTHTTTHTAPTFGFTLAHFFGSIAENMRVAAHRRSEYNRIISELSQMNDRGLADIGIARFQIEDIARAHIQGM